MRENTVLLEGELPGAAVAAAEEEAEVGKEEEEEEADDDDEEEEEEEEEGAAAETSGGIESLTEGRVTVTAPPLAAPMAPLRLGSLGLTTLRLGRTVGKVWRGT